MNPLCGIISNMPASHEKIKSYTAVNNMLAVKISLQYEYDHGLKLKEKVSVYS